ncbi:helix-turn-helix domain-containing protein [Dactylosporangium cerinum]|uniref:Helix-turn-helix domain-containing protein n=1 Tax=Dactylosporangium cerinum TaxID=1434730 RepID=A0ABV9W3J6_9ACTN
MAVVVEPVLSLEKLQSLLAEGCEQTNLDFKSECDLGTRYGIVSLVKDIAAMQSNEHGGYIVIGASDAGAPVPNLTERHLRMFDEATLRSKIVGYLQEPLDVRAARHEVDGCSVVLLYIAASPDGFHVFPRNGEYEKDDGKGGVRKEFEFRKGEVYVRRGTASTVWEPADRERVIAAIMMRRREQWRTEFRDEIVSIFSGHLTAQNLERLPTAAMTWRLDAEAFDELALELMRRKDEIPLRRGLQQAVADTAEVVSSDPADLQTLLHRVASLAALALTHRQTQWFTEALDGLVRIFEYQPTAADQSADLERRLQISGHAYALGALAVRLRDWSAVRALADRQVRGREFDYYRNWLRYSIVHANRAHLLNEATGGIIGMAHNIIRGTAALRSDVALDDGRVLDSLCQFDALTGVIFIADPDGSGSPSYFPSFARYDQERTEPVFAALATDPAMRERIAHGDDERIANAMADIDAHAQKVGVQYDGWGGLADARSRLVLRYLDHHATRTAQP